MSDDVLIKVEGVSKKFCRSLKRSMLYGLEDIVRDTLDLPLKTETLRKEEFWAVDDISFEVKRGECLGIIGQNGAGKSTLLKILSGIILPDKGKVTVRGRVGALIEVGAGFHPMLTGRENIYLNGSILGLRKKEIDRKLDEIIAFAELEDFIDMPVKHYSSGMYVRLGFAVSTALDPDILLIDEALAVGDIQFRTKCYNKIRQIKTTTAVIFVSHHRPELSRLCDVALAISNGRMRFYGCLTDAFNAYDMEFLNNTHSTLISHKNVRLKKIEVSPSELSWGENIEISAEFRATCRITNCFYRISILDIQGDCVAEWKSVHHSQPQTINPGITILKQTIGPIKLSSGTYQINFILGAENYADYLILNYSFSKISVKDGVTGLSRYQL